MIKKKYVVHIRTLKQALNRELVLKTANRIIRFSQPYFDINTKLRTEAKQDFEKNVVTLRTNQLLEKQWRTLESIAILDL